MLNVRSVRIYFKESEVFSRPRPGGNLAIYPVELRDLSTQVPKAKNMRRSTGMEVTTAVKKG